MYVELDARISIDRRVAFQNAIERTAFVGIASHFAGVNLGNVIWDQPTTAYGASQPSGATGTDTAPVGSVMAYSGFVIPTNWQLAYGQALSRTDFAALMTAITISAPGISTTLAL